MSKSRRQQPIFHGYHGWGAVLLSALLLSPTIAARTFLSALLREVAPTAATSQQNRTTPPATEVAQTPRRAEDDEHALALACEDDRHKPRLDGEPDTEAVSRVLRPDAVAWQRDRATLVLLAHALLAPATPAFAVVPDAPLLDAPIASIGDRSTAPSRPSAVRASLPPRAPPLVFAS